MLFVGTPQPCGLPLLFVQLSSTVQLQYKLASYYPNCTHQKKEIGILFPFLNYMGWFIPLKDNRVEKYHKYFWNFLDGH